MAKKVKLYEGLRQALADAREYERGATVDLQVTQMPEPPKPLKPAEIRRIRQSLHASQAVFARFLCVSPKAVQSWEQGLRQPGSTALRLLAIAKENPKVLLSA
ncbi:MAG TPA: helix-turn-helix domain-containing protein [Terriglobia bacterium]|nr:helix-turn-helix domain-containing protein [Terriglobia bacterium]